MPARAAIRLTGQAFNVVVYPSYHRGPRPVLGVDVLSFRQRQLGGGGEWSGGDEVFGQLFGTRGGGPFSVSSEFEAGVSWLRSNGRQKLCLTFR